MYKSFFCESFTCSLPFIPFKVRYESRSESDVGLEMINIREKERFMDGEKKIIIISDIASSGISLQVGNFFNNMCC